jgi:hypothetical protein
VSNLNHLTYFQLDGPICECCYYALVVALPPTLETLAFRTEEHDILADLLQGAIFFKEVFGGTLGHPVLPNLKLLVLPKKVKRLLPLDAINAAAKRGITLRFNRVRRVACPPRASAYASLPRSRNRATDPPTRQLERLTLLPVLARVDVTVASILK